MKNTRTLLAVALLVFTLGLSAHADGQMDTDKPSTGVAVPPPQTVIIQEVESDPEQTLGGQMDTTLAAVLGVIESILTLI